MDNHSSLVDKVMRRFLEEYLSIMSQVVNNRDRVDLQQKIQHKMQEVLGLPADEMLKIYSEDLSKTQKGLVTNFNVKEEIQGAITRTRFHRSEVTDIQILSFLKSGCSERCETFSLIPITNSHDFWTKEPWRLPGAEGLKKTEVLLFLFPPTKNTKKRTERTCGTGYWSETEKHPILSPVNGLEIVGHKRAFTFYVFAIRREAGSSTNEIKTVWRMHEYILNPPSSSQSEEKPSQDWGFCKVSCTGRIGVLQYEVNLKTSGDDEIVDSQHKEIEQPNYHSGVDEFEIHSQGKRGMYRDSYRSQEIAPHCHVSGMHSTLSTMIITHDQVETEAAAAAAEPQQSENVMETSEEFKPFIPEAEGRFLDNLSPTLSSGDGRNITDNPEPFLFPSLQIDLSDLPSFPIGDFGPLYSPPFSYGNEEGSFGNLEPLTSQPLSIGNEGTFVGIIDQFY